MTLGATFSDLFANFEMPKLPVVLPETGDTNVLYQITSDGDRCGLGLYEAVNNGVYRAGFATAQEAYEEVLVPLFDTLDWLEDRLSAQLYVIGDTLTEADWRLSTTLVRFDPVYVGHFKCNLRRIADYPNLSGYVRDLYQVPGIAETVDISYIKKHYYGSHETVNPTRVIPMGPAVDNTAPHDRARISQEN